MNTPINFELAKLLKEKGYEGNKSPLWYYKDGTLHNTPTNGYRGLKCWNTWQATQGVRWDAPTIADVIMWLYEKHGIFIEIKIINDSKFEYSVWKVHVNKRMNQINEPVGKNYNSPTEAYEAAIEYTLKNLIK